jgi:hypothetical protein
MAITSTAWWPSVPMVLFSPSLLRCKRLRRGGEIQHLQIDAGLRLRDGAMTRFAAIETRSWIAARAWPSPALFEVEMQQPARFSARGEPCPGRVNFAFHYLQQAL